MLNCVCQKQKIAIAILAAGKGARFLGNCPKPLAMLKGRSLLDCALTAAVDSEIAPVLLVVGHNHEKLAMKANNVSIVHNPDWHQGIASSLKAAIKVVELDYYIGALCVGLADQPLIGAEAYRRLASAYYKGATFAVATYKGYRRNPVLLARSIWTEAMKLEKDEGARVLMKSYPIVEVECNDTGNPFDIDTVEDLQYIESHWLTREKMAGTKITI